MKDRKPYLHHYKIRVYPGDTDKFGVVWHGAYVKWLEAARIELLEDMDIKFATLTEMGIVLPVVELDIRYKQSARAFEELEIITSIAEFNRSNLVFYQEIKNIETGQLLLTARVKNVAVNAEGRLYRTIPEYLRDRCNEVLHSHSM